MYLSVFESCAFGIGSEEFPSWLYRTSTVGATILDSLRVVRRDNGFLTWGKINLPIFGHDFVLDCKLKPSGSIASPRL